MNVYNAAVVYTAEYALKASLDHARREVNERILAEDALIARVQELEELLQTKATESVVDKNTIKALEQDVAALRVRNDMLTAEVRECIAAHAGSALDPDQIEARAKLAKASVEPPARTKYDEFRGKFVKHGVYIPLYHDVDLDGPVGNGNGVPVADRNDLHDLLARGVPVYGMDKRAPEGVENIPENRVKMYFPYAEIEEAQLAFEKLCPEFKANPRPGFKTASADVHHVDRSAPRLHRVPEPSSKVQRAKQSRVRDAPKRRNDKSAAVWGKK